MILGSPFFYPDYDGSAPYAIESDVEGDLGSAASRVVLLQPASVDDSPQRIRLQPLLIERQGDRYVRYGGAQGNRGPWKR